MTRQELFDLTNALRRKALELRGLGLTEAARETEFQYRELCNILQQTK